MSGQSGGRLKLSKLNEQLTCKLCGGYFIDATTIIECLHSFCRSCIVKYLNTNKYCPICEVQVHKSKPLLNIRPDHTLQDIVYKLVPGCYQSEMRCRREFYKKHPEAQRANMPPEARGEPIESHIYSPDESLSLSLEYYKPTLNESPIPCTESEDEKTDLSSINKEHSLPRRYLRCPAAVTVFHLQKLIRAKYGLSDVHRVDIMYKEEALFGNYTLMDVMYIYHWRRKVPLHLSYRIFESSSKRPKLSDDNEEFKQSLSNAGISSSNFNKEQRGDGIKKEWKEVQLKISETGIMSVTGITSSDSKKNKKMETLEENQRQLDKCVATTNISMTEKIDPICKGKINKDSSNLCPISEMPKISSDLQVGKHKLTSKVNADNRKIEKNVSEKFSRNNHESYSGDKLDQDNNKQTLLESSVGIKKNELISKSYEKSKLTSSGSTKNNNGTNPASGSKIDALSAKLQFHPKVGQVNNTYSKKGQKERKTILEKVLKNTENKKDIKEKTNRTSGGGIIANLSNKSQANTSQTTSNTFGNLSYTSAPSVSISIMKTVKDSSASAIGLGCSRIENSESSLQRHQRQNNILTNNENLARIGLDVSTAISQSSSSNYTCTVQDLVNNAMRKSPSKNVTSSHTTYNLQTPSMSIYSLASITAAKNSVSSPSNNNHGTSSDNSNTNTNNNNNNNNNVDSSNTTIQNNTANDETCATSSSSTAKLNNFKLNPETTGCYSMVPPCPDAIPISLMKSTVRKTEIIAKGTNLNEICAKIGTSGSKINDICAKIGETSKEKDKNKSEIKTRPEIPDLLKISKKPMNPNNESSIPLNIPNIPNVPCYTPSNTSVFGLADSKINKCIYTSSGQPSSSSISRTSQSVLNLIYKGGLSAMKKQSQYKTLRDPPKTWNPTLSKNSYVASKNQAKEMHQNQGSLSGFESGSGHKSGGNGNSKPIVSKPAKIFKMRNVPRYLGNPASGVKPMYGVANEGSGTNKETEEKLAKEQSSVSTATGNHRKNSGLNISVSQTDSKTVTQIGSTTKSPIVSPPPYSPSTRSYQNTPFPRDICRSTNPPLSPRNSPVNMLSTNPFIPSPTPNTNPRLIYSHYPSPFSDSTKFTNPLVRSPIGITSPSAFHSSLPPSINKLYQRTSYMSPTSSSYGQNTVSQSPTVQRTPAHSAPPKSPKSTNSSASSNLNLIKTELQTNKDSVSNTTEANESHQHINDQESNAFNFTKVTTPENVSVGIASDLSKTSSSSSRIVSSYISDNLVNSSDEESNNTSSMGTSCNKKTDSLEESKKDHKDKDEQQSNEKTEKKEDLNNIQTLNKSERSTIEKISVSNQVPIIESHSKIDEKISMDNSETTSSNSTNHTEKVILKTDNESIGLTVKEKQNDTVKKKESDSIDHSVTIDSKCVSLTKCSEQIQGMKPQQGNQTES